MLFRRRLRSKIIILILIVIAFLYWRGVKSETAQRGWDCEYHALYALCEPSNNRASWPSMWDIIKTGAKF